MPYLNCPSCGLTLNITRPGEMIEHCPRCLARNRRLVELFVSAQPRGDECTPRARGAVPARAPSENEQ